MAVVAVPELSGDPLETDWSTCPVHYVEACWVVVVVVVVVLSRCPVGRREWR